MSSGERRRRTALQKTNAIYDHCSWGEFLFVQTLLHCNHELTNRNKHNWRYKPISTRKKGLQTARRRQAREIMEPLPNAGKCASVNKRDKTWCNQYQGCTCRGDPEYSCRKDRNEPFHLISDRNSRNLWHNGKHPKWRNKHNEEGHKIQ